MAKTKEMKDKNLRLLLDSWNKPIVFVDTNHNIQYMNYPAQRHYSKWGDVIGKSIFSCHNENSQKIIEEAFLELVNGAREVLIVNSKKHRVYMRSVRNDAGSLIGYYERYDRPIQEHAEEGPSNKAL